MAKRQTPLMSLITHQQNIIELQSKFLEAMKDESRQLVEAVKEVWAEELGGRPAVAELRKPSVPVAPVILSPKELEKIVLNLIETQPRTYKQLRKLAPEQNSNRIKAALWSLQKRGRIVNRGTRRRAVWTRADPEQLAVASVVPIRG